MCNLGPAQKHRRVGLFEKYFMGLYGDFMGLWGDFMGLWGDLLGLWGELMGL